MAESIPFRKNTKEGRFDAYLAQEHLHFFHKRAVRGEADTVVYVTALPVGTYRLLAAVITDNSIYTTVRCHLGDRQPGAADEDAACAGLHAGAEAVGTFSPGIVRLERHFCHVIHLLTSAMAVSFLHTVTD